MRNKRKYSSGSISLNRTPRLESLESRSLLAADALVGLRHNLINPSDVNMDGTASPIDALMIIDELNRSGKPSGSQSPMMADTNNDGFVSPVDVLIVIDNLNSEFVKNMPNPNFGGGAGGGQVKIHKAK